MGQCVSHCWHPTLRLVGLQKGHLQDTLATTMEEKSTLLGGENDYDDDETGSLLADADILTEDQIRMLVETQMALNAEIESQLQGGIEDDEMEEAAFNELAMATLTKHQVSSSSNLQEGELRDMADIKPRTPTTTTTTTPAAIGEGSISPTAELDVDSSTGVNGKAPHTGDAADVAPTGDRPGDGDVPQGLDNDIAIANGEDDESQGEGEGERESTTTTTTIPTLQAPPSAPVPAAAT